MVIEEKTFTVYIHKNKINGKIYVGQTSLKPTERWEKDGRGYRTQFFYNAILKYGWDNFEHIIIKTGLSREEAKELEHELIIKYKSSHKKYGYNALEDCINSARTQETKDRMKKSWTKERREEQSRRFASYEHKHRKHTEEEKKN